MANLHICNMIKSLFCLMFATVFSVALLAQRLDVVNFISSDESGFVSSYILTSGKQSILVDAPMCLKDIHRLIDTVIRLNRHLSGVFITHAHPDHYLGISELRKAFPGIRVMASHEVALEIAKSGPATYDHFKTILGDQMPPPLVLPDSIVKNSLTLENCTLELISMQDGESAYSTVLYEPKQKLLFSGDIVYSKVHLYLLEQRLDGWIHELDELKSYKVLTIYPGHGKPAGMEVIEECINYIHTFQMAILTNDAVAIPDIMNYYFPGYVKIQYLKASVAKYLNTN